MQNAKKCSRGRCQYGIMREIKEKSNRTKKINMKFLVSVCAQVNSKYVEREIKNKL